MDIAIQTAKVQDKLINAATKARGKAYAPYSHFRVGAAALMSSGHVYTGANVENVSYGLTVCAERVAILKAVSEGETEIAAVAVVVDGRIAYPCGACLQVIQEFAGSEPPVIITASLDGSVEVRPLQECLPHAFSKFKTEDGEVKG